MLVRCPRCGFSQPQDRYCAKCGVDMQSFQPQKPGFFKKLILSPFFHLSLFGVIALYASLTIIRKHGANDIVPPFTQSLIAGYVKEAQSNLSEELPGASETEITDASKVSDSESPSHQETAEESQSASANSIAEGALPAAATSGASVNSLEAEKTLNAKSEEATAATNEKPILVKIFYTETKTAFLQRLAEDARRFGQFDDSNDMPFGIVQDFERRVLAAKASVDILTKEEKKLSNSKNAANWFHGINEGAGDREIGLITSLIITESNPGLYRGELDMARSWLDRELGENKKYFDLNEKQGLFWAQILPRTGLTDREGLFNTSIFKIMKSTQFRAQETDFVIYVQLQSPTP
jgi:hypothetical protein